MNLRDCLLVEVRDATTGGAIGCGAASKQPLEVERLLARMEARFVGSAIKRSGVAVVIRCPTP